MSSESLGKVEKGILAARIWGLALRFEILIRLRPLPELVRRVGEDTPRRHRRRSPALLRRAVDGTLRPGRWEPRCLVRALVLYRLLHEQGFDADVVIGLPVEAVGIDAHAWVEVDGRDLGPRPGSRGQQALARFGVRHDR